jgi:hypothetical protein
VSLLLSQEKKDDALKILSNYIKAERNKNFRTETGELIFSVSQLFLNKETQEKYEISLNETLGNQKLALKAAERCLKLDALNIDCHFQKARIHNRQKNTKAYLDSLTDIQRLLANTQYEKIIEQYAARLQPENKNKQIVVSLPNNPDEKTILSLALEMERAFSAKNYSRAKDIIVYSEKHFSDWPDLAFFKNKLNAESTENQLKIDDDLQTTYLNTCKSISKSGARKFRYDFDLCNRGENEK